MTLKSFMPLLLLLSLATGPSAQSDSILDGGWQTAQAQIPQRGPPSLSPRRSAGPPSPGAPTNLPTVAPVPVTPSIPAIPGTPPAAAAKPVAGAPAGSTNAGAGAPAGAANAGGEPADITYNFPGVPVEQLLDIYADLVGRTLLRASTGPSALSKDAVVTLKTESPLTRREAIEALETILGMNGITIVPIGDKFAKVVAEPQAGAAGGIISTNTNNFPEAGKMLTQIVQVKYTALDDLTKLLEPFSRMPKSIIALPSTQTLILRDYAENVARMVEMVKRIDVLTPLIIKPQVIKIKYALASDIASALSALGASGGTSVGKSSSGASFSAGSRSGNGLNGGIGGSSTGGMGGYGGSSGSTFGSPMGSTSALGSAATSGRSSFQNNLNRIVQNAANSGNFQLFGQTKIIADERTNSLLVFANDEDMKMIMDIINKLDVVLAQVLIDAIIMEINLDGTVSTGVSYLAQRQGGGTFTGAGGINNLSSAASGFLGGSSSTNGTGTSTTGGSTLSSLPGGFSYFSKWGNDLNVVMEAVAGDSRINVLSRPRIQTSHAVPADLFIGQTVPYVTGTYTYYGGGPSSQYTQLEVGIHLQVLPLINPDGLVVMDIQADVEQLGAPVAISGVGNVPTTTKRQAGAKVAVRDGETIILGGFISDSRSKSDSGIPGLKDIPWLGDLFKSKSINNLRTELIMLIRPTVLPTPETAAVVAKSERNKLSGVKQAELEIRHEEEENNAAIEAELAKEAAKRAEKAKKEAKEKAQHKSSGSVTNAPTIESIPPVEE
jgi:general secretion pathway protein D